jgi:hypothetical protein
MILAIIVLVFGLRMIGSSVNSIFTERQAGNVYSLSAPSSDFGYGESAKYSESGAVGLSTRNVTSATDSIYPTEPGITTGDQSEEFEVTQFNATIETRELEKNCEAIVNLKADKDIIFESASKYEKGCDYIFKAKKDKVEVVLTVIESLDPKYLSDNTYTIKGLVDDFTSEEEILKNKLESIDETLDKAVGAYNEVTTLATRVQDVETLAKIIDSKINVIERLTQERININSQLDRLQRTKSEQLDRLEYTYFNVSIYEDKFIDGQDLKDSWKETIKKFVLDINQVAQDISVNLIALLFFLFQGLLYFFILFIVAKYVWKLAKYIWKK